MVFILFLYIYAKNITMADINSPQDYPTLDETEPKQLPSGLNTLTILTYIGCGIGALSAIWGYSSVCKSVDDIANKDLPEVGGWAGDLIQSSIELMNKQCDNRLVILVSGLAAILLCFLGAAMMRKLQKQGFIVYTLGELIGPLSMVVVLGGSPMMIVSIVLAVVFVILYATQRKYLIR